MWHSLFAVALILAGFIMALIQSNQVQGQPSPTAGILIFAGFVWFVLNRLRLWWYRKQNRNQ